MTSLSTSETSSLSNVYAIVLAGGSGTRLWPLSRTLLPKQLMHLNGSLSLLQDTMTRLQAVFPSENTYVITNEEHIFEVRSQLRTIDPGLENNAIAEPLGRNTLPAIMLGLSKIVDKDPDAIVAVYPADHLVRNAQGWAASMERAIPLAQQGYLVTFGVAPDKPETGYGYIHCGEQLGENQCSVLGFKEKPDLETAKKLVADNKHFWNSGMFVFSAQMFLDAVQKHQPELWQWWGERSNTPLEDGYNRLSDISVDYGVIEKIDKLAMVQAEFDWDDLGNWEAVYRIGEKDSSGCVIQGDVLAKNCNNSLFISRGGKLAAIGLDDTIIIQTRDATLACGMDHVQQVKDVVNDLKGEGSKLIEAHVTVKRPWGSYTVLEDGENFKIKRITVPSGGKLSKQMHHHRSEHWVVISGTALVEINDEERLLSENQSVDIPKTATHRLSNPGKVPVEIIEIQTGPYLEEDDIVRFDDVYGRIKK
ncbi:mannose-1-phosphate guanylyltransferase/mannose-6-phosphate isomerase [Desulfovibrio inopinatus]|uniref:mannose-1-phosphate guanylyltransferase/mannose-6-phosphate isomerase n=1 Tax=Desulfovibrio inopinatus TaxID=102109 RepID=UPI0012EBDDA2|nr:mannose-1-phosphate guanylyltransferase/mannose-6-phosphate isomerase [Desulfovibrio inopinatus]